MNLQQIRWQQLGALLIAAGMLSGCGSLRLYSEVRDKQGMAARKAWTEVDLSSLISTERGNLKNLLDAELETQTRLATAIRNNELRGMVEAASLQEGLVDPVKARLSQVAGPDAVAQVTASRARLASFRRQTIQLDVIAEEFGFKGLALPTCAAVANGATPDALERWRKAATEQDRTAVDLALAELRRACARPENDIVQAVYTGLGGEVGAALREHADDAAAMRRSEDRATPLKTAYQVALAAYKQALSESEATPESQDKVKAALARLDQAVAALGSASDALSARFLSKERLDALDSFVDAVTESKGDGSVPEGANKATVAFILLPGLLDDARQSLAAARKPLALPLLMRRNHERLKLEAATREIEARQAKLRLSKEIVETLYEQAVALWLADRDLATVGVKALHARKFTEAFSAAGANEKELLYHSASRYLDVLNRLSARRYRLEYLRIATSHELSLAYAEINARQWQSLIGATVEQVAAYGASGIKAESVSSLLNTIGVFWIANGVNQ